MRSFLNFLARSLAVVCAIVFVATAVLALLLFNLERRAFDAQTYKKALSDQKIYERMPAILAQILSSSASYDPCTTNPVACGAENRSPENRACMEAVLGQGQYQSLVTSQRAPTALEVQQAQACNQQFPSPQPESNGPPRFLKNLAAEDWEIILQAILPPEETRSMGEQGFDSIFTFLNGGTDSAQLSLAGLKENLTSPAGVAAIMQVLRKQPPCTLEQVAKLTVASLLGKGEIEWCSPPEEIVSILQPLIEFQLQVAVAAIPDQVTLIKAPPPEARLSGVVDPRERLQRIRLMMRLSPILPQVLLLLITLLVVRSLQQWLRWWGWPLLIAGIPGMLLGFLSTPLFRLLYARILATRMPAYLSPVLGETIRDLLGAVIQEMLRPVALEGLALSLIGLAMILVARYLVRKEIAARLAASEAGTEIF